MTRIDLGTPRISSASPSGRSALALRWGDPVTAEVAETFSDGRVVLNVGGRYISAISEIPLMKGTTLGLLVDRQDVSNELRLKLLSTKSSEIDGDVAENRNADLLRTIFTDLKKAGSGERPAGVASILASLLKALASEQGRLCGDLRAGILNALRTFLRSDEDGIAARLARLTDSWPGRVNARELPLAFEFRALNIEDLSGPMIREALVGSGTVLEAKLLRIAASTQDGNVKIPSPDIETDLKARLLMMLQSLRDGQWSGDSGRNETMFVLVDQMLRDIETFQAISKVTGSWSTFLPLDWEDLREGDISLRRGQDKAGNDFFSCRIDLEIRDLGKVSVTIVFRQRELYVTFSCRSAEFRKTLDEHSPQLFRSMAERGLALRAVNVVDGSGESAAVPEHGESDGGLVSMKV